MILTGTINLGNDFTMTRLFFISVYTKNSKKNVSIFNFKGDFLYKLVVDSGYKSTFYFRFLRDQYCYEICNTNLLLCYITFILSFG